VSGISRSERNLILIFIILGTLFLCLSYTQKINSSAIQQIESDENLIFPLININTASTAELEHLPGIGPVMAREIISHRDASGGFKSKEGLKDVKGIGGKKFEKIRDLIIISE